MDTNEAYRTEYEVKAIAIIANNFAVIGSPVPIKAAALIASLWVMVLSEQIPIDQLEATFEKAWKAKPSREITIVTLRDMVTTWRREKDLFTRAGRPAIVNHQQRTGR